MWRDRIKQNNKITMFLGLPSIVNKKFHPSVHNHWSFWPRNQNCTHNRVQVEWLSHCCRAEDDCQRIKQKLA